MAEANFLAVTDTFLSRLIMKSWLTCALDDKCLIASTSQTLCSGHSAGVHRYDQSAMVIILSYFFFQGNRSSWSNGNANDPAPYDMFTSVQKKLGEIQRGESHNGYLANKPIVQTIDCYRSRSFFIEYFFIISLLYFFGNNHGREEEEEGKKQKMF